MARVIIKHWPDIHAHLAAQLDAEGRKLERAETQEQMWRAQGRAQAFREMLNLPDILAVLQEGA